MAVSGLAQIKALRAENERKEAERNRPKANWFKWPERTTVATVRFLQEIDEDSEHYNSDRGRMIVATEHVSPEDFKRRASCTADEGSGECFACERHANGRYENPDYKGGWKQKQNLYIFALVDFGNGKDPEVMLLTRNFNSSFAASLIEEALPEDEGGEGSITNANYKITKTGEGTKTQWLLKRLKGAPLDDSGIELPDLKEVALREIPYEEQEKFYGKSVTVQVEALGSKVSQDTEW